MSQKIEFRRRREVGELVSTTFEFIRQNFKPLSLSLLYVGLPLAVLQGAILTLYQNSLADAQNTTDVADAFSRVFGVEFFLSLLLSFVLYGGVSAAVYSFVQRYIAQPDPDLIQVNDVIADTLNTALAVLTTALLLGVILFIVALPSFFLFFIPVLYVSVATAPIIIIRLVEQKGFFEAFSRSFQLTQGNWWRVFATLLVIGLVGYLISFIFSLPSIVLNFIVTFNAASSDALDMLLQVLFSSLSTLGSVVLNGLLSIGIAFIYFDLVERKESSGLMERIEQISK